MRCLHHDRHHLQNRQRSLNMRAPAPSPKPPVQFQHACSGTIPKTASAISTCLLRHHPQNRQSSFNMRATAPSPKPPAQLMHASCPYDSTATRRIFLEVPVSSLTCIILIKSTVHVASSCSRISGGLSCVYLYTLSMFALSDSL